MASLMHEQKAYQASGAKAVCLALKVLDIVLDIVLDVLDIIILDGFAQSGSLLVLWTSPTRALHA